MPLVADSAPKIPATEPRLDPALLEEVRSLEAGYFEEHFEENRALEGLMEPRAPSNNSTMTEFMAMMVEIIEMMEKAAPPMAAVSMISIVNMAMPQLISSAPSLGSAPVNFAGSQPGTPGGGFLPTAIANPTVIAGNSLFAGLGLVGVGQLVRVFDLPQTNGNFAAIAGIFEEGNVPQSRRQRGKREIRKQIISFAKLLLWINQTIEKGQSKIFRYTGICIYILHLLHWALG